MSKTVVVTGAAQNIGLAIALKFAEQGAQVIVADIHPPQQPNLIFIETDITEEASVKNLFSTIEQRFGCVDVLVNNAGTVIEKKFSDMRLDEWQKVMDVNVTGVFLCSKYAILQMQQNPTKPTKGVIINMGSIEGLGANPTHSVYAASKGAVHSLTRNIAIDHGKDGIRCNAIAPGWINTPFNESLIQQFSDPQHALNEIHALHPLGALGTPQDIAELAVWLASDQSKFINGQVISIDGGRMAKLPLPAL